MENIVLYVAGIIFGVVMVVYGFVGTREAKKLKVLVLKNKMKSQQVNLYHRKKVINFLLYIVGILLVGNGILGITLPLEGSLKSLYLIIYVALLLIYIIVYQIYSPKNKKRK